MEQPIKDIAFYINEVVVYAKGFKHVKRSNAATADIDDIEVSSSNGIVSLDGHIIVQAFTKGNIIVNTLLPFEVLIHKYGRTDISTSHIGEKTHAFIEVEIGIYPLGKIESITLVKVIENPTEEPTKKLVKTDNGITLNNKEM